MNDAQWVLARIGLGEQQAWLTGFDESDPVWVASVDEAMAYDGEGAEAAVLQCTNLPDDDDVLYAVCRLKTEGDMRAMLLGLRGNPQDASVDPKAWAGSQGKTILPHRLVR